MSVAEGVKRKEEGIDNNSKPEFKERKIGFFSKLSTKIAILVTAMVIVSMLTLTILSVRRTMSTMEETYKTYARNLAEEAAVGIDFATEYGEETYQNYAKNLAESLAESVDSSSDALEKAYLNYAMNLAESATVNINATIDSAQEVYQNYAQNLAEEATVAVDYAASLGQELTNARLTRLLGSITIKDVEGSYAYMVSPTGTMLWHPTESKIGQPVENAAVKGIVEQLAAGKKVEDGSIIYEYKGAMKLAGYAFTAAGNILVVTADVDKFVNIDYDRLLGSIEISGVEGSYAYMVSQDGTMLWHPTASKIGQPVENAAVKGLVEKLSAGETPESIGNGAIMYEYKGANKVAGYAFASNGNIIIVTADYDKFVKIDYDDLLADVEISGVEGSYAYMVEPDGTMLWHPTASKIGQPVENAAVKGIVADLEAGKKVENGAIIYEYKGSDKVAGYAFDKLGNIVIVTADYDKFIKIDYDSLIGGIEISGVEGSYAYMVSPTGTMLWHKEAAKIGEPVENAAVKGIVADLEAGKKVENDAVVYEYKGSDKMAGYAFTKAGNIVVVTADYTTMIKPVIQHRNTLIVLNTIAMIIAAVIGFVVVTGMLKAFELLLPVIGRTAQFDFREAPEADKLLTRKDELGAMSEALAYLRSNLRDMVGDMRVASDTIEGNVNDLQGVTANVNVMCTDNSATSQQLAASMEETSASTTSISENINSMQNDARDIEQKAIEGATMSDDVMKRADELRKTTDEATKKTIDIYDSMKAKSEVAIEASKAVDKINELTNTIMAISSQTSLLALNASIEAARAGEAGRGFSVVATEIGNLATQTAAAVKDISGIVNEVNGAVDKMADCVTETIGFLEEKVLKDYGDFGKVSEQYRADAEEFKGSMGNIRESIVNFNEAIATIVEAVDGINVTIAEAADGVTEIAGKTSDMVAETGGTTVKVDECRKSVEVLDAIVARFILD